MIHRSFNLLNSSDEKINGNLRYREDAKNAPTIIICHGFKGFKDWGFFPFLADSLADDGYVTVSFNFSRNGIGSDPNSFTELEKFEENTYTHELEDLKCVVDIVCSGEIGKSKIDNQRIGLLGHSRGGGLALLYANRDDRIQALVTWSAIARVERFSNEVIKKWKKDGFIEMENTRTKQMMRLNKSFIDDIRKNRKKLDILKAAANLEIPALVMHGEKDESVPVSEANEIYNQMKGFGKKLEIIEDGSHTFGISHPLKSLSKEFEVVLDLTEIFFDKNLNIL